MPNGVAITWYGHASFGLVGPGGERILLDPWLSGPTFPPALKETLDAICPDRPVCLLSTDFHTMWTNSRALEIAGIDLGLEERIGNGDRRRVREEHTTDDVIADHEHQKDRPVGPRPPTRQPGRRPLLRALGPLRGIRFRAVAGCCIGHCFELTHVPCRSGTCSVLPLQE